MKEELEKGLVRQLVNDNNKMRKAGNNLAEASIRVIRDYDGIHRLALAVSEWAITIANEGKRKLKRSISKII